MSNLISLNRKNGLRRIYFTRLIYSVISWISFALLFTFFALFVVFAMTELELRRYEQLYDSMKNETKISDLQNRNDYPVRALIDLGESVLLKNSISITDALRSLNAMFDSTSIQMKTLSFERGDDKSLVLHVSAVAVEKEDVINFVQILKASKTFYDIDVPALISSLRQDENAILHFKFSLKYGTYEK